jgi:hypothetical protein
LDVTVRFAAARLVAPARLVVTVRFAAARLVAPARLVVTVRFAPACLVAPARLVVTVRFAAARLVAPARLADVARLVVFGFVPDAPGPRAWRPVERTRFFAGFAAARPDEMVPDTFVEVAFDVLFFATSEAVRAGRLRLPAFLAGALAADRVAADAGRERSMVLIESAPLRQPNRRRTIRARWP